MSHSSLNSPFQAGDSEILFKNKDLEVSKDGDKLFLVVSNFKIANKINDALGNYYPCRVLRGEEPIFKITLAEVKKLQNSGLRPTLLSTLVEICKKL